MIEIAKDIKLPPITEGVIPDGVASHYVAPKNAVENAENFHNDILGVMSPRPSVGSVFVPESTDYWSAALFQVSSGENRIYYQQNTSLNYRVANTGLGLVSYPTVFPADYKARYDTVQGHLVMTAGSNPIKVTDGTSAPTTPTISPSAPFTMDLVSAGFVGRIWYASSTASNNRVYYTNVIPSSGPASVTGASEFLTVPAQNGDFVTGLVKTQQVLFVFTGNGIFRIYNTQSQDNSPVSNVGALNQESITTTPDGIYFYHPTGFYKLSESGQAVSISNRIRSILPASGDGIDFADCKAFYGYDYVYFAFNKPFVNNNSTRIGQVIYRYTISTQVWTVFNVQSLELKATATSYNRLGRYRNYLLGFQRFSGANIACLFEEYPISGKLIGFGNDDFAVGNNILYSYNTHYYDFDLEYKNKQIRGISFPHSNMTGAQVMYQIDTMDQSDWMTIGTLSSEAVTNFQDFISKPFRRIRFKVATSKFGVSNGSIAWVGSPTIMKLLDLGED